MAKMMTMMTDMVKEKERAESKEDANKKHNVSSEESSLNKQSVLSTIKIHINKPVRDTVNQGEIQERMDREKPCNPIPITYTELFRILLEKGLVILISFKPNTYPEAYNENAICGYHGSVSHTTENCELLKNEVDDVIKGGWLEFKDGRPKFHLTINRKPEAAKLRKSSESPIPIKCLGQSSNSTIQESKSHTTVSNRIKDDKFHFDPIPI
ncbi:hypothetical protein V6N12_016918 [Hibiscus sabdariffa]|uniref:Uncharacterized protein n=1 Tax=Hibiscus sabdariffa TaxID=183260 RepID=A0ABR2B3P7_9ROSI